MMDDSESLPDEIEENRRRRILNGMIVFDLSYVTDTWLGRVKFFELIFITLAGCILPSVIGVFFTRFSFYTFVVWTSFMYISLDLILHVTSLWRRMPKLCTSSDILLYPVLMGALAFMISSCLVASVADHFPGSRGTRCGLSAAFGFLTMLLFLIEAFLHYRNIPHNNNNDEDEEEGERTISGPIFRGTEHPPPYTHQDRDLSAAPERGVFL